jgi:hypothetical protein
MWLTGRLTPDHRRLPTSARTMARRSAKCARAFRAVPHDGFAHASQRRD